MDRSILAIFALLFLLPGCSEEKVFFVAAHRFAQTLIGCLSLASSKLSHPSLRFGPTIVCSKIVELFSKFWVTQTCWRLWFKAPCQERVFHPTNPAS